jgi:PhzF family phenazine biosynthesis protein
MPAPRQRYFVVDAFTDRPFAGNPAAVVPLERWPDARWLQDVAMEMNLAETAFLVPDGGGGGGFDLRWFTPTVEVDLCGHATIASAVVLAELGQLADGAGVAFSTRSGVLGARRRGARIELDFPSLTADACAAPAGLLEGLGVAAAAPAYVGRGRFDYLVELADERAVRGVAPDFKRLAGVDCRGVIVTARSDDAERFDFVSRFFCPALGVDEDPVTGSAHCMLATHWAPRLGKAAMVGYQASARGGTVHVELRGERVALGGEGVVFASGEIRVG